ncbi:hydrolase [Streptomyces inusitatus]|uniref:Hydrolase n=1 Tax=Streptomyces inusitatus TaxID=68221 RepID=A0A918PUQ8_9ACTN|nr:VOC family protein [Streptomyces inusitatus]GGZ22753.1 hydrolase [Streptomyces inusitatus]
MAVRPEGTPCWADGMFPDLAAAKSFYGELFGWTFGESSEEFGNYTQASVDGGTVAALMPQEPGSERPPAWNLYFATSDARATAAKIRENGGTLIADSVEVGGFGTMVVAQDPSGIHFSAWQPASHQGFERTGTPGAYAWADLCTREVRKADAFFPSVFPFEVKRMESDQVDYHVWSIGGEPVAGRLRMTDNFPADAPPFINVYFAVAGVDAAVATVRRLGGQLLYGPHPSPFGRFAPVMDQQGAVFTLIDPADKEGETPTFS